MIRATTLFLFLLLSALTHIVIIYFKVWPHAEYPLIPVGKLVLNRNPTDYFAEVEQIAFSPAHMIPGIEPSPDKMLQVYDYMQVHVRSCVKLRLYT
jgi:hypothetical protein